MQLINEQFGALKSAFRKVKRNHSTKFNNTRKIICSFVLEKGIKYRFDSFFENKVKFILINGSKYADASFFMNNFREVVWHAPFYSK